MYKRQSQWYVQKGSRVQGPFSANEVGRFLLLGRVRNTDRVSRDGELWEPVTQVPELIPEELLDLDTDQGWQRFLHARTRTDEREMDANVMVERRVIPDETAEQLRDDWHVEPVPSAPTSILPWSLLGITIAALGVVLYLNTSAGFTP